MDTTEHSTATVTAPRPGRYSIDPDRSTVAFRTRHLFGLQAVRGSFALRGGTVDVAEPAATSLAAAEIDAAGLRSGSAARDRAVRSARFLDAERHPVIAFASDRVEGTTVTGTLTVRGVARPVSLEITRAEPTADGFAADAVARVDRTAFGVTAARGMAGRHLDLALHVECVRAG